MANSKAGYIAAGVLGTGLVGAVLLASKLSGAAKTTGVAPATTGSCWQVIPLQDIVESPAEFRLEVAVDSSDPLAAKFTQQMLGDVVGGLHQLLPGIQIEGAWTFNDQGGKFAQFGPMPPPQDWVIMPQQTPKARMRFAFRSQYTWDSFEMGALLTFLKLPAKLSWTLMRCLEGWAAIPPMTFPVQWNIVPPSTTGQGGQPNSYDLPAWLYRISTPPFAPTIEQGSQMLTSLGFTTLRFFNAGMLPSDWPASDQDPNRWRFDVAFTQGGTAKLGVAAKLFKLGLPSGMLFGT